MVSEGTSVPIKTEIKYEYCPHYQEETHIKSEIKLEDYADEDKTAICCSCGENIACFSNGIKIKHETVHSVTTDEPQTQTDLSTTETKEEQVIAIKYFLDDSEVNIMSCENTEYHDIVAPSEPIRQFPQQLEPVDEILVCSMCKKEYPNKNDFSLHKKYCRTYIRSNLKRKSSSKEHDVIVEIQPEDSSVLNKSISCFNFDENNIDADTADRNVIKREPFHQCGILPYTNPADLFCTICKNYFADKGRFLVHKIKKLCIAFDYASSSICLNTDYNTVENKVDVHMAKCDVSADTEPQSKKHCQINIKGINNNAVSCKLCNDLFMNQHQFTDHIITKHSEAEFYTCMQCKKTFQSKDGLLDHLYNTNIHSLNQPCTRSCGICSMTFKSKSALKYHKHMVHSARKYYSCIYCRRTFVSKSGLQIHQNIHCPFFRPDSLLCKQIKEEIKEENAEPIFPQNIADHDARRFRCAVCNVSTFKSRRGLRYHQNVIHSESCAQQFNCTECKKSFKSKRGQKLHEIWYCSFFRPDRPLCNETFKVEKLILDNTQGCREGLENNQKEVYKNLERVL